MPVLWKERWPEIAHHVLDDGTTCVETVAGAEPGRRQEVKFSLPCDECPESGACLNAKRKELGPLMYDREIMTRPRTSESSLFPFELFEPCLHRDEQCVAYYNKPFSLEDRYGVASAWDIAWSEKIGGDWLVRMTGLVDRETGLRRLLDVERWQRITFRDQIDLIAAGWAMFKDDLVVVEDDFAQRIWVQEVERETAVPVMPHSARQKQDFAFGVPGLIIDLEMRRWAFPYCQGTYHHEHVETFLAEAEAFGWVDGKLQGVGEHDDTVMAWWHLAWALDRLAPDQHRREMHRGIVPGARI